MYPKNGGPIKKTTKEICASDATLAAEVLSVNFAAAETASGNNTAVPPPIIKKPNSAKYEEFEKETKINPKNIAIMDNLATFLLPNFSTMLSA